MFLHCLEKRCLRARWRTIDLVGKNDVREDRTFDEPERAAACCRVFFHDLRAGDVAWNEIGRELNPAELEVHRLAHAADHERLRETGHSNEQRMSAGEESHEDLLYDCFLPDDSARDFLAQSRCCGKQFFAGA